MTRMLVSLLTRGAPDQLTGGYLYHQRIAQLAPSHGAQVEFLSVRAASDPVGGLGGDVVLVDSIAAAAVAPWTWRCHQPMAAIIHQRPGGIDGGRLRRALQAPFDRALYRRCELLLAASDALAAELAAVPNRFPAERVRVVAPGRDVAPPDDRPAPDLRRGRQAAFVSVGNWVARKGTLELLDAFAQLPENRATLHLAGRDDVEPRYARRVHGRIATPELRGRTVYHGAVSRDDVARLYRGADAFVLASYEEPYGTVYGEALAAGLPVVGWRAGNLPNLADDDVEGVMVEPADVDALARALDRLATDEAWRRGLAAAAARRGAQLPTWSDTAAAVFGALRGLLTGAQ
jgi:glycosyltransferase involved in cell wall biosynthesis